jgi:hypothetical protein
MICFSKLQFYFESMNIERTNRVHFSNFENILETNSPLVSPIAELSLSLAPQPSLGLGLPRNLLPLKMAEFLGGFSTILFFTG